MWKLVNEDGFFPGVPNRDLEDWEMNDAEKAIEGIKDCGKWVQEKNNPVNATPKPKSTIEAPTGSTTEAPA